MEFAHVERGQQPSTLTCSDKTLLSTCSAYAETSWEAASSVSAFGSEPVTICRQSADAQQLALDRPAQRTPDALFKDVRLWTGGCSLTKRTRDPRRDTAALAYVLSIGT
jgi:hypothetical protein